MLPSKFGLSYTLYKQANCERLKKASFLFDRLSTSLIPSPKVRSINIVSIKNHLPHRSICTSDATFCNEKQELNGKHKIGKNTINYNEFENYRMKGSALIIDVRSPEELKKNGEIPNTINIPIGLITSYFHGEYVNDFENDYGVPIPGADEPIIVFCKMGIRSEMARKLLTSAPSGGTIYKNVASYEGSYDEWSQLSTKNG